MAEQPKKKQYAWEVTSDEIDALAKQHLPKLQERYQAFVDLYAQQNFCRPAEAYKQAFGCQDNTATRRVYDLMHDNKKVALAIAILRARIWRNTRTALECVVENLKSIADDTNMPPTARVAASKELRRILLPNGGLFGDLMDDDSTVTLNVSVSAPKSVSPTDCPAPTDEKSK